MRMLSEPFMRKLTRLATLALMGLGTLSAAAAADKPVFNHPLDGKPIETPLKQDEKESPALKKFKETGTNVYRNDGSAVKAGKVLFEEWCLACHGADASGKMGPPLIGKQHIYQQTNDDVGMFAIIYGGASGAMQPFGKRDLSQDDILKIIAYVRSLDRK